MYFTRNGLNSIVSHWKTSVSPSWGKVEGYSFAHSLKMTLAIFTALILLYFRKTSATPKLPIYAPLEIAITKLCFSAGGISLKLRRSLRRYNGSLFGITTRHQVIYELQNVEKLLAQSHHVLDNHAVDWTMFTRVFGASKHENLQAKLRDAKKELFGAVERAFLSENGSSAALLRANVPDRARKLVSFTDEEQELSMWERSARVHLVQDNAVEADLMSLMRDFGACVAIPLLYGHDFLERYPNCLTDLWNFDHSCFPLLMIGCPEWIPIKAFQDGLAARRRLIREIKDLYRRIEQHQTGAPIDGNADMSDVSQTASSRSESFRKHGFSMDHRGITDFALLWGQNGNTQPVIFWFTLSIYSTPGLLSALREEVATHIRVDNGEITSFSYEGILHESPLLKSTLYENFRKFNDPASIRYVAKPLVIPDDNYMHNIKAGTWISVPHSTCQGDPNIFSSPETFMPDRFLEYDPATGVKIARQGRLKPWGAGVGMCKGRTFAEKEILCVAAAVISLWDICPAEGEAWALPDIRPGTGVVRPAHDVRVRITRRE